MKKYDPEKDYPKTEMDWWALVDLYWCNLEKIIIKYNANQYIKAKSAKLLKDWEKLWLCFQIAWQRAPDHISIHSNPAWDVFCDLCSETQVFDPRDDFKFYETLGG